jgi:hypothetical protein
MSTLLTTVKIKDLVMNVVLIGGEAKTTLSFPQQTPAIFTLNIECERLSLTADR